MVTVNTNEPINLNLHAFSIVVIVIVVNFLWALVKVVQAVGHAIPQREVIRSPYQSPRTAAI